MRTLCPTSRLDVMLHVVDSGELPLNARVVYGITAKHVRCMQACNAILDGCETPESGPFVPKSSHKPQF